MKNLVRQGDVLFVPDVMPEQEHHPLLAKLEAKADGMIAKGEATGHHHRIATLEDAEVFETGSGMFVRVGSNGVSIVHEEHAPVTLEPNTTYKVHRAREHDYLTAMTRVVRD